MIWKRLVEKFNSLKLVSRDLRAILTYHMWNFAENRLSLACRKLWKSRRHFSWWQTTCMWERKINFCLQFKFLCVRKPWWNTCSYFCNIIQFWIPVPWACKTSIPLTLSDCNNFWTMCVLYYNSQKICQINSFSILRVLRDIVQHPVEICIIFSLLALIIVIIHFNLQ